MAWPFRGRRESIIRDESFIFIGRTRGISKELSIVPCTSRAFCSAQRLTRSINLVFLQGQPVFAVSCLRPFFHCASLPKISIAREIYRVDRYAIYNIALLVNLSNFFKWLLLIVVLILLKNLSVYIHINVRCTWFRVRASCYTNPVSLILPWPLQVRPRVCTRIRVHASKAAAPNKAFTLSGRVAFIIEFAFPFNVNESVESMSIDPTSVVQNRKWGSRVLIAEHARG